jgi:drug/metabolite transporter (DMT)-like permease
MVGKNQSCDAEVNGLTAGMTAERGAVRGGMGESRSKALSASNGLLWLALSTVYVVWGSTYLAIRVVVRTIPPFVSAGTRFLVGALLVGGFLAARFGWRRLRVRPAELASCTFVGGMLLLGGNGLVTIAEQHIASGLAALVVAAVPLWIVLFRFGSGDRPATATIAAVLVGFGGIALLLAPGGGSTRIVGILTVLVASLLWSIGSYGAPRLRLPADPFVTTVYEMVAGGVLMLIVAAARGEFGRFHPSEISGESAWAWLYLVIAGSVLAFTAYVWLLQNAPISLVATYAYVNPAVAVLLGALILGEQVTWPVLVGGLVVIASVAIVVSVEHRPKLPPVTTAVPPDVPVAVD